jgi:hypothetical protein
LVSIMARLRNRLPRTHGSILDRGNECFLYSVQSSSGVQAATLPPPPPPRGGGRGGFLQAKIVGGWVGDI